MKANEKKRKADEIAEKYQFQAMSSWNERTLKKKFKELFNDLVSLEIENSVLKQKLEHVKQSELKDLKPNKYEGYSSDWNGIEKVIFVLERNKIPMLTKEIAKELLLIEPELKQKWKNTFANVSNYIYRAIKFNRILKGKKIGDYGFQYKINLNDS